MAGGEVQDGQMKVYQSQMQELDEKRNGLDIEIQELLSEMDTQASFTEVKKIVPKEDGEGEESEPEEKSKMQILVDKLVER